MTDKKRFRPPTAQLVFRVRLVMVIFLSAAILLQTPSVIRETWPPRATALNLPEPAARRLLQVAKNRRAFNDYEFSSYMQWRCAGQPSLYIDLLNAYPDQLLKDYFKIIRAEPQGRKLLRDLKIDAVYLRPVKKDEGMSKLVAYLNKEPQWRRVYKGKDGAIWLKKDVRKTSKKQVQARVK